MTKLTKGELLAAIGIDDTEKTYEQLRSELDIRNCRGCGDEFVAQQGYPSGTVCSDLCEVEREVPV